MSARHRGPEISLRRAGCALLGVSLGGKRLDEIDEAAANLRVSDFHECPVQLQTFSRGQKVDHVVGARRLRHAGRVEGKRCGRNCGGAPARGVTVDGSRRGASVSHGVRGRGGACAWTGPCACGASKPSSASPSHPPARPWSSGTPDRSSRGGSPAQVWLRPVARVKSCGRAAAAGGGGWGGVRGGMGFERVGQLPAEGKAPPGRGGLRGRGPERGHPRTCGAEARPE